MPTFVALLRGINVGKAKRVPMAELRVLLEGLGFSAVQTLLNSGNVVFSHSAGSAEEHAKTIAEALQSHFGFDVPVVVKSVAELKSIVEHNPLVMSDTNPSRLLVIFAQSERPPSALQQLAEAAQPPDQLVLGDRAAYLYCPDGILASPIGGRTLAGLGDLITTRNWATVLKLLTLATDSDAVMPKLPD